MIPLIGIGPMELVIVLVIVLLLFGGSRLAGLGKNAGRAIREFKEETDDIRGSSPAPEEPAAVTKDPSGRPATEPTSRAEVHEAEVVDPETKKDA